ncbi:hypothetical protein [Saccharothrix stipae]
MRNRDAPGAYPRDNGYSSISGRAPPRPPGRFRAIPHEPGPPGVPWP